MNKLFMEGPYPFTEDRIRDIVSKTSPGNYSLGYVNEDGSFVVRYVGRSDFDVRTRLISHLGENYKSFKFSYASSPKAAFEKECHNYHDFGGSDYLNNKIHPDRPRNANWKCPCCNIYG